MGLGWHQGLQGWCCCMSGWALYPWVDSSTPVPPWKGSEWHKIHVVPWLCARKALPAQCLSINKEPRSFPQLAQHLIKVQLFWMVVTKEGEWSLMAFVPCAWLVSRVCA